MLYRLALLFLLVFLAVPLHGQNYQIRDLGPLLPAAINNRGQIAGNLVERGQNRAVLWTAGQGILLPTFSAGWSVAHDLNDAGQVVGASQTSHDEFAPPRGVTFGFRWTPGRLEMLGAGNGEFSAAYGINSAGQAVGNSTSLGMHAFPVLWTPNSHGAELPLPRGRGVFEGWAYAINNLGHIAGAALTVPGWEAVLWREGAAIPLPHRIPDEGIISEAYDLNDAGTVVGVSAGFPVRWPREGGVMVLRNGPGAALAINATGTIVGRVVSFGAMRWDRASGLQNLNNLLVNGTGWKLVEARDVNDAGQVVGVGTLEGVTRGFLLTPRR